MITSNTGVAFRECLDGAPGDLRQSPDRDGKGEPHIDSFMGLTSLGGVSVTSKVHDAGPNYTGVLLDHVFPLVTGLS
jgi:hypothetical protein